MSEALETGGAAFPSPGVAMVDRQTGAIYQQGASEGMSLRDYFAGRAMEGLLSAAPSGLPLEAMNTFFANVPIAAYQIADGMIEARKQ